MVILMHANPGRSFIDKVLSVKVKVMRSPQLLKNQIPTTSKDAS